MAQDLGNAEVTELDNVEAVQEDVLALDVSVDDVVVVDVFDGEGGLGEEVEDVFFRERGYFEEGGQVAFVGVVHDDAEFAPFGFVDF